MIATTRNWKGNVRHLSAGLILLAVACGHDGGPVPIDGGSYVLTSSSEGPPPVVVYRLIDAADGSTRTNYVIADKVTFVRGTGHVVRDITSSQVVETPGSPAQTMSASGQDNGDWSQSGDRVVISWHYWYGGQQSTIVDTLQAVNGQLKGHWLRSQCSGCGSSVLDVTYVRDATH